MMRHTRIRQLADDERGFSLVFVAVGLMGFLAASMLAIDVGMLMTARNQAQNSADAGALAGATALAFDDWNDRSATGPAVSNALAAARANQVMSGVVSVTVPDVVFLNDPNGLNDRVQVTVYRNANRSNALPTLIAQYFGIATVDVSAVATAEASPANAETCVKPWTIPDKWVENTAPPWSPTSTFDLFDSQGNPLPNPDVYIPVDQPNYSGYNAVTDAGTQVVLKPNNGSKTFPSFYNAWAIPPSTGSNWYSNNIQSCNTYIQPIGDLLLMEPGNQVGPTSQGTQALIDRDPGAYWDTNCRCVKGSAFGKSPRIAIIPVYDPYYYETGKKNGRTASLKVANWIGIFIESIQAGNVTGRITQPGGLRVNNLGPAPVGAFPRVIRLVQ